MTEGYKDFIVHLDMYFLPDQLPFKFRNWGWEGTVLQNGVAVYILCVLERKSVLSPAYEPRCFWHLWSQRETAEIKSPAGNLSSWIRSSVGCSWPGKKQLSCCLCPLSRLISAAWEETRILENRSTWPSDPSGANSLISAFLRPVCQAVLLGTGEATYPWNNDSCWTFYGKQEGSAQEDGIHCKKKRWETRGEGRGGEALSNNLVICRQYLSAEEKQHYVLVFLIGQNHYQMCLHLLDLLRQMVVSQRKWIMPNSLSLWSQPQAEGVVLTIANHLMKPNMKSQKQLGPAYMCSGLGLGLREVQGSIDQHDIVFIITSWAVLA